VRAAFTAALMVSGNDPERVVSSCRRLRANLRAILATPSGKPARVPVIPAFCRCLPGRV